MNSTLSDHSIHQSRQTDIQQFDRQTDRQTHTHTHTHTHTQTHTHAHTQSSYTHMYIHVHTCTLSLSLSLSLSHTHTHVYTHTHTCINTAYTTLSKSHSNTSKQKRRNTSNIIIKILINKLWSNHPTHLLAFCSSAHTEDSLSMFHQFAMCVVRMSVKLLCVTPRERLHPLHTTNITHTLCNNQNGNSNSNCIQRCNLRFFIISLLCSEPSPTRTLKWPGRNFVQITCNTSSAYHMQHVACHIVRRDSSAIKFERV